MTKKKRLFLILSVLWACFIFGQSMMSASASYEESTALYEPVQQISDEITHTDFRKLAHFLIFSVWGGLLYGLFRQYERFHLLKPLSIALCGAFADETIQLFVPGRYSEVRDVWIDLAGATLSVVLVHITATLTLRRKQRTKEKPL